MVTNVQSYQPYSELLDSVGPGESDYAFTGEAYDSYITDGLASQGLIYLRSRYYAPGLIIPVYSRPDGFNTFP
ncbi:hypothetical protein ACFLZW_00170 [Chloroflexota bacterium]